MNHTQMSDLRAYMSGRMSEQGLFNRSVSMALGVAISKLLSLSLPRGDYRTHIDGHISAFNEYIPVDIGLTRSVAIGLLSIRKTMDAIGRDSMSIPMLPGGFLEKYMGIRLDLAEGDAAFLNANSEPILAFSNRILALLSAEEAAKASRSAYEAEKSLK